MSAKDARYVVIGTYYGDDVKRCNTCGGLPTVVYAMLRLDGKQNKMGYCHCPCNDSVTDWQVGTTKEEAIEKAKQAWQDAKLISGKAKKS